MFKFKKTICFGASAYFAHSIYEQKYRRAVNVQRKERMDLLPSQMAMAEKQIDIFDYQQPSFLDKLRAEEFTGDLSKIPEENKRKFDYKIKTREQNLIELQDPKTQYDILIVGGGANGCGVVLDAASRGLKCAVIDKYDFASGTSSRSTKMAHGGIRYLEQMMMLEGDPIKSYHLLKEALNERNYFLQCAPYLNRELKLLIPSESFFDSAFWYYPGALLYHLIYMKQLIRTEYQSSLSGPRIMRKKQVIEEYPNSVMVHGKYGVKMHEAQMIDSRMNLNCLFTSSIEKYHPGMQGATLANYVEFKDFVKQDGKIVGAKLRDTITNKEFEVKTKVVVNCAGIQSDEIRIKDQPEVQPRIQGARGTHLMFKKGLLPEDAGIIIPKTKDGRLLFIINYLGHPMVGTTDEKCEITHHCQPSKEEIGFICKELEPYFGPEYDFEANLVSAWAGIRPLVRANGEEEETGYFAQALRWVAQKVHSGKEKKSSDTARLSRSHIIEVSDSGLVSLLGGKWTSFRHMGEETVEKILQVNDLTPKHQETQTLKFNFIGSYSRTQALTGLILDQKLLQEEYLNHIMFTRDQPREVAQHLVHTYGTSSTRILDDGDVNQKKGLKIGLNEKIHEDYPFLKSEITYAIKHEMAVKPNDVICRRVPIAFLDKKIAEDLLPEVVEIMAKERKWSSAQKAQELKEAKEMLQYMK